MTTQQFFIRVIGGTAVALLTLIVLGVLLLMALPHAPQFFGDLGRGLGSIVGAVASFFGDFFVAIAYLFESIF